MVDNKNQDSVTFSTDDLKLRYMRERQGTALIITVTCIACIFLVCLLLAVLPQLSPSNDKSTNVASGDIAPCIPFENQKAVSASEITVRVLNATGLTGFGTAVSKSLEIRGFRIVEPESFGEIISNTEIHFGANAIAQAYTLAGNLNSPTLVLDDRKDGLIDVIIGRDFQDLKDRYLVTTSNLNYVLPNPDKCKTIHDIVPHPAIDHDTTLVAPYTDVDKILNDTTDSPDSSELTTPEQATEEQAAEDETPAE